ncbi:MAG: helix-turn-helix transcriptional regulator [Bacteroidetes bacterium]|nr:helix-turn-helix transcriptional regulator [Bacteroidota bacterium]
MAQPKASSKFENIIQEYSALAKVLGHPARIAILKSLMERNNQTCKELVMQLPYSQSTVSQHLYRLRNAGLVEGMNYKTAVIYAVHQDHLFRFNQMFHDVFGRKKDDKQLSLF